MRKILLAVIGARADQKAFSYALQLSRQMGAELDVLQMVKARDRRNAQRQWPGVTHHMETQAGDPHLELINYLNEHRDVLFTVYDVPADLEHQMKTQHKKIEYQLPVPLVVIRH